MLGAYTPTGSRRKRKKGDISKISQKKAYTVSSCHFQTYLSSKIILAEVKALSDNVVKRLVYNDDFNEFCHCS